MIALSIRYLRKQLRWPKIFSRQRILLSYKKWLFALVGSFIAITTVYWVHNLSNLILNNDGVLLIGSFGASAVILFVTPHSPYAMPRHVIGGHVVSALVGVTIFHLGLHPSLNWLSASMAVSLAVLLMEITRTTHPPGGATALIAIIGSNTVHKLGYWYVLTPVLSGTALLLVVLFVVKTISKQLHLYPY